MKITEIWRYPVKSMLGEKLDEADVSPDGIRGDRHWAVIDADTGVSLSAKRYADLLNCRAWTADDGVLIRLPNGGEYAAGSDEAAAGLSELLGRNVTTRSADEVDRIQHEFPTAVTEGEGEPFLHEPKTAAFFDSAPLHLLTNATLEELERMQPESHFHRARFRPNFVVETDESGLVEHGWIGKDLVLGSLRCRVTAHMQRCIMVARSQSDLPLDMQVIRSVLKNNDGNVGVKLLMLESGRLSSGDGVQLAG